MAETASGLTIVNGRVFTPFEVIDPGCVAICQGRIVAVGRSVEPTGEVLDVGGRIVAPGMIDLQINGAFGHDCMSGRPEDIATLCRSLPSTGCTAYLPTMTTARQDQLVAALRAAAQARRSAPRGARILGFHVEGPHISSSLEGRGAHDPAHIRPFSPAEWQELTEAAEGGIRILTLAPEVDGNLQHIRELREAGVVVSIGHTSATYDQAAAAVRAGATLATHIFNGMRGLHHREPGAVGAILDLEQVAAGLIADGHHVHPAVMRVLLRAKGVDGVVAVSDAAWMAGLPAGEYTWGGRPLRFDGLVPRMEDGRLAGSALTMAQALTNLVHMVGLPLQGALRLVTTNPARVLSAGALTGTLTAGGTADLVILEPNLQVAATLVGGEIVYRSPGF